MRDDFVVFIITHKRPDNQITYKTLKRGKYTGKIIFVLDDGDDTIDAYCEKYGKENIQVFHKYEDFDIGDNLTDHKGVPVYARNIGVDIDNLYISQPDSGEQALEICETMVRSGAIDIVIVDSVAALVPKAEIDGDMGDSHVGLQARLMSQALRKLTPVVSKNNCVVIFINQLREKVGVMFGNPETTTGGRALKFYASVRMDVRKIETLKSGGEVVGNRTRVKVVKNKVAPPFREAEFDIMFGKGISTEGDLIDLASNVGIIQKSGAWFSYNGEKIGQGRENAKQYLINNPDIRNEVDEKVRAHYGIGDNPDNDKEETVTEESKTKSSKKENTEEV